MPGTGTHASAIVNFFSLTRVIKYTMHSMRMNTGYPTVRIAQILGVNEEVVALIARGRRNAEAGGGEQYWCRTDPPAKAPFSLSLWCSISDEPENCDLL